MCVACALCVSVLLHSRTSALPHLAGTALPTPVRSHTGSHWSSAPCVLLLQCTASLPGGSGQWNSCNALPHCPGGSGQWNSWCGVVWCGVVWCGVVWCGVVWCGVVWCGVVWCGVVWCGVVWCGVVWCGVVWCDVPKAVLPKGNSRDGLALRKMQAGRAVCLSTCCVVCCAPRTAPVPGPISIEGCPGHALPLHLVVQLAFSHCPRHHAPCTRAGLDEAIWSSGVGQPNPLQLQ